MTNMDTILACLQEARKAKECNSRIIQAKQSMLEVALINKASPEELEKARQELIDAFTSSVDIAIEMYKKTVAKLEHIK